jgi:hypothetical protein
MVIQKIMREEDAIKVREAVSSLRENHILKLKQENSGVVRGLLKHAHHS